jgi:DNA-binding XRE family transcriptional regulator
MHGYVRIGEKESIVPREDSGQPVLVRLLVNGDQNVRTEDDELAFMRAISGIRKELGLTQLGFAKLVGASKNTVYRWEKGEWLPSRILQKHLLAKLEGKISKPTASALARAMLADPTQESGYVEPPPAPPPAPPKDLVAARAALDACILAGAEALDVGPGKVRDVLAAVEALALDARTARSLVARAPKGASGAKG